MDLIIKNGKVVTAEKTQVAEVGIEKGKIAKIGRDLKANGAQVIEAKDKYLFPGGIDMHVHLNLFFCNTYSEDWDTATAAAACGGVTTIIDFAIQTKGKTLKEAVESRMKDAEGKVAIDYSLHGGITDWNARTREEMNYYTLNGIPSFKMFMIYRSQGWMADDGILFSALEETKKSGAILMLHAESAFILDLLTERYHTEEMMKRYGAYCHTLSRPCFTEYEAIQRAVTWAKITGGRVYIVHMSTSEGAQIVAQAKREGVKIWAETCPQFLLLTDEVFKKEKGHYFASCPQMKKKHDAEGLLKAIKSGGVEILATDTCSFNTEQKDMWQGDFTKIPHGLPGVETLLPTMYTFLVGKNKISLNRFVSLVSTNPAKLFGLYPQKGEIKVGSDADLVIFDPKKKVTLDYKNLTTKCDWSPFQGMKLVGYPEITISRGKIIAKDGKFVGKKGWGQFVPRKAYGRI
ncbi:dihydropyrimidinase [bacterium]|nr:dihydropyrimidinase [bacterium]